MIHAVASNHRHRLAGDDQPSPSPATLAYAPRDDLAQAADKWGETSTVRGLVSNKEAEFANLRQA